MSSFRWQCPTCGGLWTFAAEQFPVRCCGKKYVFPEGVIGEADGKPYRKRDEPCLHRGPELRREECPSCKGTVQVKVFACDIFAEATLAKPLPGVQTCESCPRYESA